MLPSIAYTTLAIDLGLHGSWQKFLYLQCFDYTLLQATERMAHIISYLYHFANFFANYREVQGINSLLCVPFSQLSEED